MIREIFSTIKEAIHYQPPPDTWEEVRPADNSRRKGRRDLPAEPLEQTLARLRCSGSVDTSPLTNSLQLHINILKNDQRVSPRFDVPAEQCPDMQTLYSKFVEHGNTTSFDPWRISILLPDGLTSVQSDSEWMVALLRARAIDWLDGELKVVVQI